MGKGKFREIKETLDGAEKMQSNQGDYSNNCDILCFLMKTPGTLMLQNLRLSCTK